MTQGPARAIHVDIRGEHAVGPYRAACDLMFDASLLHRVAWSRDDAGAPEATAEVLLAASGPWSAGERAVAEIAAALLGANDVQLDAALLHLPQEHIEAVIRAIRVAAG
ncbi:hypothetical protein [Demequina sp.]|uniref:hypothetical protein n=1 Tax=Demequina sp. TaxID=2050685 RepID=UPI003D0DBF75